MRRALDFLGRVLLSAAMLVAFPIGLLLVIPAVLSAALGMAGSFLRDVWAPPPAPPPNRRRPTLEVVTKPPAVRL